jgi:hypothetical protein
MKRKESIDIKSIDIIKAGALAVMLGLGISCSTDQEKDELQEWYTTIDETTGLSCADIENLDSGKYEKYVRQDCENFFEWEKATGLFEVFADSTDNINACSDYNIEWAENNAIETNRITTSNVVANGYVYNLFLKNCAHERSAEGLRGEDLFMRCRDERAEMHYDDALGIFKAQRDSCFGGVDQPHRVPNIPTQPECEIGWNPQRNACMEFADPKRIPIVLDSLAVEASKFKTIVDPATGFSCDSQKEEVSGITTNRSYCTCRTLSNYESLINGDGALETECTTSNGGELPFTDSDIYCDRNLLYYAKLPGGENGDAISSMAYFKKRTKCAVAAFAEGLRGTEIEETCYEDYSKYQDAFRNQSQLSCVTNGGLSEKIRCINNMLSTFNPPSADAFVSCGLPFELFEMQK